MCRKLTHLSDVDRVLQTNIFQDSRVPVLSTPARCLLVRTVLEVIGFDYFRLRKLFNYDVAVAIDDFLFLDVINIQQRSAMLSMCYLHTILPVKYIYILVLTFYSFKQDIFTTQFHSCFSAVFSIIFTCVGLFSSFLQDHIFTVFQHNYLLFSQEISSKNSRDLNFIKLFKQM